MIIPPAFRFKGSIEKAKLLKSQALQFYNFSVNQLKIGGISFSNKKVILKDGSIIDIIIKKENTYNHITGVVTIYAVNNPKIPLTDETIYLESGFLHLGSTALCVEETYKQGYLYYNDYIKPYLLLEAPLEGEGLLDNAVDSADTPFSGAGIIEGSLSKTLVGTMTKSITDFCGNTYVSDNEIYGDIDTWRRKYCQQYVPSSLYSGKLRLLIQSIYGSIRTDYYPVALTANPDSKAYEVVMAGMRLQYNTPTTGLFTTSNYEYYLIYCDRDSFKFYKLKLSDIAISWLAVLKDHPRKTERDFSNRVEAYALSTAILDDKAPVQEVPTLLGLTEGGPYAYGFKFNWSGSQVKCVWHRSVGDDTYRSRVITIDIVETDGIFTLTSSLSSEEAWSNSQFFQYWYPDDYNYSMATAGHIPAPFIYSTGCPMYGYYDDLDIWQQFEIICEVSNSDPTSDTGPLTQDHLNGLFGYDAPNYSRRVVSGSTQTFGVVGYKWKGVTSVHPISVAITVNEYKNPIIGDASSHWNGAFSSPGDGYFTRDNGYVLPYLTSTYPAAINMYGWKYSGTYSFGPLPPGIPPFVPTISYLPVDSNKFGAGVSSITLASFTRVVDAADICETMFAVAQTDCQCIIYGIFQGISWTEKRTGYGGLSGVIYKPIQTLEEVSVNSSGSVIGTSNYKYLDIEQKLALSGLNPKDVVANILGAGVETTSTIYMDHSSSSNPLYGATGPSTILTETLNSQTPSGASEKYFRNGNFLGPLSPYLSARSSAGGAHILNYSDSSGVVEKGYPNGTYSAIGWA